LLRLASREAAVSDAERAAGQANVRRKHSGANATPTRLNVSFCIDAQRRIYMLNRCSKALQKKRVAELMCIKAGQA
jgi:hypothetical protein